MPPSWCCTVLRFSSTLTCPLATTAPDKGAVADQIATSAATMRHRQQHPPNLPDELDARARIAVALREQRGEGHGMSCFHASASAACRRAWTGAIADCGDGAQPRQDRRRGAEGFERTVLQHRELVELRHQRRAMPDHDGGHAARLELCERGAQRRFALRVEIGVGLVQHHQPRIAVQRSRERDALALTARQDARRPRRSACRSRRAGAGSSRAHARAARPATTCSEFDRTRGGRCSRATVPANSSTSCGR